MQLFKMLEQTFETGYKARKEYKAFDVPHGAPAHRSGAGGAHDHTRACSAAILAHADVTHALVHQSRRPRCE